MFICVYPRLKSAASLDDDGVFEPGFGKGFASTLLGELFDVETVGLPANYDAITAAGDLDDEVLHPATGAIGDSLQNNFIQWHMNSAPEKDDCPVGAHGSGIRARFVVVERHRGVIIR